VAKVIAIVIVIVKCKQFATAINIYQSYPAGLCMHFMNDDTELWLGPDFRKIISWS